MKTITIYKIVCNDENVKDVYVGSTKDFARRCMDHKYNTNGRYFNLKVYQFIRANGGWDNWSMKPIKVFNCNTKKERLLEERRYVEKLNSTLNSSIPGRTHKESDKEWWDNNKQYIKQYREKNKDKIKEYQQSYKIKNKDKINEYRIKNKDKINAQARARYAKKKQERLNQVI